jgi:CAAX protease family protein
VALEASMKWVGGETDLSEMYFDPIMMDTPPRVALAAVNAVLWGPLSEELTFRGLVYLSLRAIAGPPVAAFGSAALFAAAHLYSLEASLAIFASGLVLAAAVERYRTLLPGLVCHVTANLFFVLSNLVSYR